MSAEETIVGFPPIAAVGARALVLGSMPSVASLEKNQYYGKPQNAFWRLMGEIYGIQPQLPYAERSAQLASVGVAVWDVVASCVRPGSLDSAIDMNSVRVNDFATFFDAYPTIQRVYFNGRKAEDIFKRRVAPDLSALHPSLRYTTLPSTSPAMASLDFAAKLERWHALSG
jgi:TDG/mug DNA glycosylase family protein